MKLKRSAYNQARLAVHYELYEKTLGGHYDGLVIEGRGHFAPKVVFVGDSPTVLDDQAGLAFAGRTGSFVAELMASNGLNPEHAFFTYYNKYKQPPKADANTVDEAAVCSHLLRSELKILDPIVVVPMGRGPVSIFMEDVPHMDTIAGRPVFRRDLIVLPTYHPAQALYDTHTRELAERHFLVLADIIKGRRTR